jgi:hypothetical protein
VTLIIVDETSFTGSGQEIFPIRRFGGFYVTAADGMGCPGDTPSTTRRADVWGHFVTYVIPNPNAGASEDLCDFSELGTCVARLVE